jgi:hypothetical protein
MKYNYIMTDICLLHDMLIYLLMSVCFCIHVIRKCTLLRRFLRKLPASISNFMVIRRIMKLLNERGLIQSAPTLPGSAVRNVNTIASCMSF